MTALFRVCGAILVGLVALPAYRLLYGREIGIIGDDVLVFTEQDRALIVIGTPIALALGAILARLMDADRIERLVIRAGRALTSVPTWGFALAAAAFATLYTAGFSLWVLDGKPNLIDAMAQLLHARFVATGQLAAPVDRWMEFWHIQNSLVTPAGWVSQYPPGHVLLLAGGFLLGAVWLVGPILAGLAIYFTALAAERLLPADRGVARTGVILAAASSFFIAHAGAYMNHVSAAAMGAAAVYFAVRARDEASIRWPVLCGAAVGAAFAVRPLAAVALAATAAVILTSAWREPASIRTRWLPALAGLGVGAIPFGVAVAAYNAKFFGSPFSFGYTAAWGPPTGLGFHRDPWGNNYGVVEAVGFTSADLTSLSLHLLGSPIPVVLVVGLFLLAARRLETGERIIAVWALLPVVANALYWHHGMFMGPRMLNEAAPAWALLTAVAAIGLVRRVPQAWNAREYSARGTLTAAFFLSAVAGMVYLGPDRLWQYGGTWMQSTRIDVPRASTPALVFVHGGWTGRIAARLAANGMRLDSLETALRRNPTCDVHQFAAHYSDPRAAPAPARPLDFSLRTGELRPRILISQGNWMRMRDGDRLTAECYREVAADTSGIVDVAPLLWQGDVPGGAVKGSMIVRDMGPAANAALIAAHPDRVPMLFMRRHDDEPPVLVPYATGASLLWSSAEPR